MTIEHRTPIFEKSLEIYKNIGFTGIDMESVGGGKGTYLLSPDGKDMVNLISNPESKFSDCRNQSIIPIFPIEDKDFLEKMKNKGYKIKVYDLLGSLRMPDGFTIKFEILW